MIGSRPLRWIVAGIAAFALATSFVWTPSTLPKFELCLLRRFAGVPCPGCGLTRAFCAISHGDVTAAWSFNPFGVAFYALALALIAWPFAALAWPGLDRALASSRVLRHGAVVFVVALAVFGITRAAVVLAER